MAGTIRKVEMEGKLTAFGHDIMPIQITGIFAYCSGEIYTCKTDDGELINAWVETGEVLGNQNMMVEIIA